MTQLINIQGLVFKNEQAARDYYGDRFDTAILETYEDAY